MKYAIPVDDDQKSVCVSFGRAPFFMIWDSDQKEAVCHANPAAEAQSGAGVRAAQFVADQQVQGLITVRCGENAAEIMQAADIKILKAQGTDALWNAENCEKLEELTHFHGGYYGGR